jgi:hypothetical protein
MTIELPEGRLLRLRQGAGNTLTMRRGSVWNDAALSLE